MKGKNISTTFKDIIKLCLSILKHNTAYHLASLMIWLFLSVLPLISGLILKKLFDSINLQGKNEYFTNILLLAGVLLCNVFFTYQGGIFDTKSRFYIGKILRVNLFKYFISKFTAFNNSAMLNMFNTDIDIIEN